MATRSTGYGALAVLAMVWSAGCLQQDVTHTLYVGPADVTWSTIETHVRSDEKDPGARQAEEQDYLLAARAGRGGVARALASLGATRVETRVLRGDRPFTVLTQGHVGDPAALVQALMRQAGIRGDAAVARDGCRLTLTAWADVEQESDATGDIASLAADLPAYRIVLTDGRFVSATGFSLEGDGAVAVPVETEPDPTGIVRVSLDWIEGGCAVSQGPTPPAGRPRG